MSKWRKWDEQKPDNQSRVLVVDIEGNSYVCEIFNGRALSKPGAWRVHPVYWTTINLPKEGKT